VIKWLANLTRLRWSNAAKSARAVRLCWSRSSRWHLPLASRSGTAVMPRILLVEDDRDVRLILEHVLIDDGHQVDATGTMAEGNRLLETCPYDLVAADARLL
jgi:hypothetical protein